MAALTEIPVERKINTPLRGNDTTLRHEIGGQLFAAKIQNADMSSRNSGEQFLDSESEAGTQTQLGSAVKAGEGPSESSFSQSLNQLVVDKSSQPPGEIVRSPTVPFTQPVNENDILQQVMQKFRVSRYLQDSKLELKLHPAELGELKISIQLKDGTINANIVAQSQQVVGILEKNLPRLKDLMEQQGLHVEEISIHLDADVPSDYDLFEEQSAQDSSPFSNRKNNHSGVAFTLESADEEDGSADNPFQPGVNVKI
jgi:flagellar hook-length control protein FliK